MNENVFEIPASVRSMILWNPVCIVVSPENPVTSLYTPVASPPQEVTLSGCLCAELHLFISICNVQCGEECFTWFFANLFGYQVHEVV